MAEQSERLLFSLEVDQRGAEKELGKFTASLQKLRTQRSALQKQLKELQKDETANADAIRKTAAELAKTNVQIKSQSREVRALQKEVKAGNASYTELSNTLSTLTKRYKDFRVGVDGSESDLAALQKRIKGISDELKAQDAGLGNFQRNVGDYRNAITGALDSAGIGIGNITAALANPILAVGAAVSGLVQAGGAFFNYLDGLSERQKQAAQATGLSGEALNQFTSATSAAATTLGLDYLQTLEATNKAAQIFGTSQLEAANLFQQAAATQADGGQTLISTFESVAGRANDAGIELEQLYALIAQEQGLVGESGKGVEAVAEAIVSLREQTPATRKAIQGLGLDADQIFATFQTDGFAAVQQISGAINELGDRSPAVGAALADIFRGAGEDAGLAYIKTLENVSLNLDDVIAGSDEYTKRQFRLIEANEKLNEVFDSLAGTAGGFFDEVNVRAREYLAVFLERGGELLLETVNFFRQLYNESIAFRGVMNLIGVAFQTGLDLSRNFFGFILDGFRTTGQLIRAVWTGEFSSIPDILSNAAAGIGTRLKSTAGDVAQNFVDGWQDVVNPGTLEPLTFDSPEVKASARQQGTNLGTAFVEGYKQIVQKQIQGIAQEAQQTLNTQLAENDRLTALRDDVAGIRVEATQSEEDAAKARAISNEQEIAADSARIESVRALSQAVKQAAGERSEAAKAAAIVEKLAAATEIGINLQKEISGYYQAYSAIPGGVGIATGFSIAAGIRAAASLAQLAGFAEGGYTSQHGIPDPNLPGERITGYVHANEYVVPAKVLNTPQGASYVRGLEAMRTGLPGYASGGFTGTGVATQSAISRAELSGVIRTVMASMPPQYVAVTDINAGQRRLNVVQSRATI